MTDNPITKKITRHVSGYWRGYPGANIHHAPKWTVGLLQRIVADCRAAGFDDNTELAAEIQRDPFALCAFRLTITEDVPSDEQIEPLLCASIAPRLAPLQQPQQCALVDGHVGAHSSDAKPGLNSMRWWTT